MLKAAKNLYTSLQTGAEAKTYRGTICDTLHLTSAIQSRHIGVDSTPGRLRHEPQWPFREGFVQHCKYYHAVVWQESVRCGRHLEVELVESQHADRHASSSQQRQRVVTATRKDARDAADADAPDMLTAQVLWLSLENKLS